MTIVSSRWIVATAVAAFVAGCEHAAPIEPVEVQPARMTLDVNTEVDRELGEFFAFERAPVAESKASTPREPTAVEDRSP